MTNVKQAVELEAQSLQIGQSWYIDCPACGRQKKMGISRILEGVLYNCFSTSCGEKGFTGSNYQGSPKATAPVANPRWVGVPEPITLDDDLFFRTAFGVKLVDRWPRENVLWNVQVTPNDEYLFPIHNAKGSRIGEVIRQPVWSKHDCHRVGRQWMPKARTYIAAGQPKIDVVRGDPNILVLVEDQISAVKVQQTTGFTGVALLGNDISADSTMALTKFNPTAVLLWLDPDMREHSYRLAAKVGGIFRDFRVIHSEEDPKETPRDEIRSLLSE